MKTAFLYCIDEAALQPLLPLRRVGLWHGDAPEGQLSESLKPRLDDSCAIVRAKGSLAGYAVIEGLRNVRPFDKGETLGGTEALPVTAFHLRMYEAAIMALAKALRGYDQIVARAFEKGRPRKPLGRMAQQPVQVYDNHQWAAPGHVTEDCFVWEVVKPKDSAEVGERKPKRKSHAPAKRKTRRAGSKKKEAK